ncbi:hypothetical protein [Paenibacillus odorifer]|uniref:hypothetical protein n=1 Tax=Paenibacillus odorifer TaxID=189426 RepID=UPI0015C3B09A|nr:hypothetical protein [Paenibacillus odorifer]
MLEYIKLLAPYILPLLNLILGVRVFRYNKERDRKKELAERENDAPLPPRSKRHKR